MSLSTCLEDHLLGLPSQLGSIVAVLLPCWTLWSQRRLIAAHPEAMVFLPVLLTHAAYMAVGTWRAMEQEAARPRRRSWAGLLRMHLRKGTVGATPFAGLVLVLGLAFPRLRPFAVVAALAILLSTVVGVLQVVALSTVSLRMQLLGGPLTAAALFGVVTSCYLLTARVLFRA